MYCGDFTARALKAQILPQSPNDGKRMSTHLHVLSFRARARVLIAAVLACAFACAPAAAASLFDGFVGEWRGSGVVTTDTGEKAPLRCTVEVLGEVGERASQILRCATTGSVIRINSSMRIAGAGVLGSWSNDLGDSGGLKGDIDADTIDVELIAENMDARMVSRRQGCRMTVTIKGDLGKISDLKVDLEKGC